MQFVKRGREGGRREANRNVRVGWGRERGGEGKEGMAVVQTKGTVMGDGVWTMEGCKPHARHPLRWVAVFVSSDL